MQRRVAIGVGKGLEMIWPWYRMRRVDKDDPLVARVAALEALHEGLTGQFRTIQEDLQAIRSWQDRTGGGTKVILVLATLIGFANLHTLWNRVTDWLGTGSAQH